MRVQSKSSQKLIRELKAFCESYQIPKEIQDIYLEAFESISKAKLHNFLILETENYKKGTALIVLCLNSILAREESIKSIRRLNLTLIGTKNWVLIDEVIMECAEIFEAYRNLTFNVAVNFVKWRMQMEESLDSSNIDIYYEGCSYIGTLENLPEFLLESQFSRVFHFLKFDPFLVKCSRVMEASQSFICLKNTYYLIVTEEIYNKAIDLENQLFNQKSKTPIQHKITLKKVSSDLKPATTKTLTPARASSNKKIIFKEKRQNSVNARNEISSKLKKTGFKFIDKVLENYYISKQNSSKDSKNQPNADSLINSDNTQTLNLDSKDLNLHSKQSNEPPKPYKAKSKLPPIFNPRLNDPENDLKSSSIIDLPSKTTEKKVAPRTKAKNYEKEDSETRNFMSVERMVEKSQVCEDVLNDLLKIFIKKNDLYSLAYDELQNARNEKSALEKKEIDLAIAKGIKDDLIEFYLTVCNFEGLIQEVVYLCIENTRKNVKISENIKITETVLDEILETFLESISYEDIVEMCINFILETHKNAIKALTKVQNMNEKTLKLLGGQIIEESVIHLLTNLIVSNSIQEVKEDIEFDSIDSNKVLSLFTESHVFDHAGIQYFMFSNSKFSSGSKEPSESKQEMMMIGSRCVIISALLESGYDFFGCDSKNRLQKDFVDLIKIYSTLTANERPVKGKTFSLKLEVPYKAVEFEEGSYFFFRSVVGLYKNNYLIYEIQTTDRNYSICFIQAPNLLEELETELKSFKFDLFSKVEVILSQESSSREYNNDILIPFFQKSLTWKVSWIEGLQLSEDLHIKSCIECIFLNFSHPYLSSLPPSESSFKTLKPPFIYCKFSIGLCNTQLFTSLKIPLIVSLITTSDIGRK